MIEETFEVSVTRARDDAIITCRGHLHEQDAAQLSDEIQRCLVSGCRSLALECGEILDADDEAVTILGHALDRCRAAGVTVEVAFRAPMLRRSPKLREALEIREWDFGDGEEAAGNRRVRIRAFSPTPGGRGRKSLLSLAIDRPRHGLTAITFGGELDIASAEDVYGELLDTLAAEPERLVVDLRSLRFIDSSGLRTLHRTAAKARELGIRFTVITPPPPIDRVFRITGLDRELELVERIEDLET